MARFRLTSPRVKVKERDVKRACLDILRYRGFLPIPLTVGLFKTPDGRYVRIGEPGLPDVVVARFFVELKRPGGELSSEQVAKIREFECYGVPTVVPDSPEALVAWLAEYQKKKAQSE